MSAGAAQAGASLVSGLIQAKQERKRRIMEAKDKEREAVEKGGERKAKAINSIINNLRSATR